MEPAIRPSQRASVVGVIAPISASSVQTSGWVDATTFFNYLAIISTGVMQATGTVDAKIQQATSSGGAGAKDVTGKAITQITQAASGSGTQQLINVRAEDLDLNNGFKWIRVSVTPATAASLISATLLGFDPRNMAADASISGTNTNAASTQTQVL
jgi:hypothetical protein